MKTAQKAPASSLSSKQSGEDVIELLTKDHSDVKKLFKEYQKLAQDKAPAAKRSAIAQEVCAALTVHATVEEELFYPAVRSAADAAQPQLDEAEVEHASVKELIDQIQDMEPDDDLFDAKMKVLGEYVDHHAKEEEAEMFPKAKKEDLDLKELGAQVRARKEELQAAMEETD